MSIEGHRLGHFLTLFFPGFVIFYTRPRYQVSVYRTIGPLVFCLNDNAGLTLINFTAWSNFAS